jgi:predicted amino acid racemase
VGRPALRVELAKIEQNARAVVTLCREHGIAVTGVTKGTCGLPEVARAMLRGGVESIGDSRLENVERMRGAGVGAPFMMLRIPPLSRADGSSRSCEASPRPRCGDPAGTTSS